MHREEKYADAYNLIKHRTTAKMQNFWRDQNFKFK